MRHLRVVWALRWAVLLALPYGAVSTGANDAKDMRVLIEAAYGYGGGGGGDVLLQTERAVERLEVHEERTDSMYEPAFAAFGRDILGRAASETVQLTSDTATQLNLDAGAVLNFVYEKSTIEARREMRGELRRRVEEVGEDEDENDEVDEADDAKDGLNPGKRGLRRRDTVTVYLSANTCMQPQAVSTNATGTSAQAPQLTMYVSLTSSNAQPGPDADASLQTWQVFTEGAVMMAVEASDSVYVGIAAPNVTATELSGIYNFQVAASVSGYYHSYDNDSAANLVWVDSDASSALMITNNLTNSTDEATDGAIMDYEPYVMFAQNTAYPVIRGVQLSYCGLETYAQIASTDGSGGPSSSVFTSMTRRGAGNLPKQQFYFSGLNASASYVGILVNQPGNGSSAVGAPDTVGGGGHVTRATSFSTKAAEGNCEVVFNLTFCNETAYAVPGNRFRFENASVLAQTYDDYAAGMFAIFQKALAQIPCEAPAAQRYSLARTCDDCRAAYKTWLCSVAIPRCSDFSEADVWLQPRAISQPYPNGTYLDPATALQYPNTSAYNGSRNAFIDETIQPGPYKEVLPCDDLCHGLVQSCPADLGFDCPLPSAYGYNTSYGQRTKADDNGAVTCNYPGSAHYYSGGPGGPGPAWTWLVAVALLVVL